MNNLDDLSINKPHELLKTARNYIKLYKDQLTSNMILYKKYKLLKNCENETYENLLQQINKLKDDNNNLQRKSDFLLIQNNKLENEIKLYRSNSIKHVIIYPSMNK